MTPSRAILPALLALCLLVAACGGGDDDERAPSPGPQVGVKGEEPEAAEDLGFPAFATKNTTRVGGADSVATAAAVARAVYPSVEQASRAKAVTVPAFMAALTSGYNINVATTTLDSANARIFASFTPGGGPVLKSTMA